MPDTVLLVLETAPVDDDTSVARLPNRSYVGTPFVRISVRSVIWITIYMCSYIGDILSKLIDLLRRAEIVDISLRNPINYEKTQIFAKTRKKLKNSIPGTVFSAAGNNFNNLMLDTVRLPPPQGGRNNCGHAKLNKIYHASSGLPSICGIAGPANSPLTFALPADIFKGLGRGGKSCRIRTHE